MPLEEDSAAAEPHATLLSLRARPPFVWLCCRLLKLLSPLGSDSDGLSMLLTDAEGLLGVWDNLRQALEACQTGNHHHRNYETTSSSRPLQAPWQAHGCQPACLPTPLSRRGR